MFPSSTMTAGTSDRFNVPRSVRFLIPCFA